MYRFTITFALWIAGLVQAQTAPYKIGGQVVRETGDALNGARVSIFVSQHSDKQISCLSGNNGEFLFTGIPAGKYSLQVSYRGLQRLYKQNREYSTGIVVGPGLDTEHIRFEWKTPASIVGSVLDDVGDPVRNATIYLLSRDVYHGMPRTGLNQTRTTAPDGSFHFTNLQPGTYFVAVSGRPWYAQGPMITNDGSGHTTVKPPAPELDVAYPVTYYAGTTSPDAATPIELQHGSRVQVQFRLQAVPAVHLAFEDVDKQPEQQVIGNVSQVGPGGTMLGVQAFATNAGVSGIAPGSYMLSLSLMGSGKATPLSSQQIDAASDSTIAIEKGSAISVSGRVLLDGTIPQGLAVVLEETLNSNGRPAGVWSDGEFAITDIPPGTYNLRLAGPDMYINSVSVKGADYKNGVLEVKHGEHIELTIQAAKGLSEIDGIATRDGKGLEGVLVIAIPQSYTHGNYIPRDQSDSDGSFSLRFAPPGRYTIVAIEDGNNLEYANPSVITAYLAGGRVVDVPFAPHTRVEVEVQTLKK